MRSASIHLDILQQRGNEKYDANMPPVDMAEKRLGDFHLAPPGWGMDCNSDEDLDFPLGRELLRELNWIGDVVLQPLIGYRFA